MTMRATPEEDDVKAGDENRRGQIEIERRFDLAGHSGVQSSVENGHKAEEYQVSSTSGSRASPPV
jgi:hypothetical protein